jgi:hypothetical protein
MGKTSAMGKSRVQWVKQVRCGKTTLGPISEEVLEVVLLIVYCAEAGGRVRTFNDAL